MTSDASIYPPVVYVDANFLIYLFYEGHNWQERARSWWFRLIAEGTVLAISNLALDETWFSLVSCLYKKDNPNKQIHPKRLWWAACVQKYLTVLRNCHNFVTTYSRTGRIRLVGTKYETVEKAFNLMSSVPLMPRDAFHVALLQQENIDAILTIDPDFENVSDIKVYNWSQKPT